MRFDPRTGRLEVDGQPLDLSPLESRAFKLLYEAAGNVVWKEDLVGALWPDDPLAFDPQTGDLTPLTKDNLDQLIRRLRRKLREDSDQPRYLTTVRAVGYTLHWPWPRSGASVPLASLTDLWARARFTSQLWPQPAAEVQYPPIPVISRGMGALPEGAPVQQPAQYGYRLGSPVRLGVALERPGHLLLLDEGPEGTLYCLCPSQFAPSTYLTPGVSYLPQPGARYDAFVMTGQPGREKLLAVVTDDPLDLDWLPSDPRTPARILSPDDCADLLARLRVLPPERWTAVTTYFDVTL
jgi:DNA-binding winged helix-turn-helix (wHTH) protein